MRSHHLHIYKILLLRTPLHTKKGLSITGKPHKLEVFIDYSTIVATLPEPTVRPPSRSFELVLVCLRGKFC